MGPTIASNIGYANWLGDVKNYIGSYWGGFAIAELIPPAIMMDIEYGFSKNLSARFMFVINGTGDDIDLKDGNPSALAPINSMSTSYFILSIGYSFSL